MGEDLDPTVEVDRFADECFDPATREGADGLDGLAARADDDPLLRLALHEQGHPNVHGLFGFAKLLDLGGKAVWELVLEQLEGSLAEILDDEEAHRLGADVLRIKLEAALGQTLPHPREQSIDPFAALRRDDQRVASELAAAG